MSTTSSSPASAVGVPLEVRLPVRAQDAGHAIPSACRKVVVSVPDRRPRRGAGQLEGEVLAALHAADRPLTPGEVQRALGADLAYTTVMTILTRLHGKGLATRVPAGRGFAYSPSESEAQTVARQMHSLLALGTDRAAVLARFFDGLDPEEEQLLARLLDTPARTDED